jgi:formate dehydrogenase iron-sulfur subunit
MEPRYGILIDLTRCIGCQGCVVACKTGNELVPGQQYIEIQEHVHGQFPNLSGGFLTHRCYHCGDAACVAVCPTGALYKKYRLTAVDAEKCIACERCVKACPYGIPQMVNDRISKCTGCMELIESGGIPWCVQTCPSGALKFGSRRDLMNEALNGLDSIQGQFPNAQIYGQTEAGGLSVFLILPDEPSAFGLPVDLEPVIRSERRAAVQSDVRPTSAGTLILGLGIGALTSLFSRRQRVKESQTIELEGIK